MESFGSSTLFWGYFVSHIEQLSQNFAHFATMSPSENVNFFAALHFFLPPNPPLWGGTGYSPKGEYAGSRTAPRRLQRLNTPCTHLSDLTRIKIFSKK